MAEKLIGRRHWRQRRRYQMKNRKIQEGKKAIRKERRQGKHRISGGQKNKQAGKKPSKKQNTKGQKTKENNN